MAERGDLGGMSFGFRTLGNWTDQRTRELRSVELVEVSSSHAFPAYPQPWCRRGREFTAPYLSPAARRRLIEAL